MQDLMGSQWSWMRVGVVCCQGLSWRKPLQLSFAHTGACPGPYGGSRTGHYSSSRDRWYQWNGHEFLSELESVGWSLEMFLDGKIWPDLGIMWCGSNPGWHRGFGPRGRQRWGKEEIYNVSEKRLGHQSHELSFDTVEFEKIEWHPGLTQACRDEMVMTI